MAICAQQSEVPLVGSPILTATCPIVLAALGFDFLGWVNVVNIKRAGIRETAARAFRAKTRNEFKLFAPIVRVFGYRVTVPPGLLAFRFAELRGAWRSALSAKTFSAPSGFKVASLTAVFAGSVLDTASVHLSFGTAMQACDLNAGLSHDASISKYAAPIHPGYFETACKRIEAAYAQPDFFVEQEKAPAPKQEALL